MAESNSSRFTFSLRTLLAMVAASCLVSLAVGYFLRAYLRPPEPKYDLDGWVSMPSKELETDAWSLLYVMDMETGGNLYGITTYGQVRFTVIPSEKSVVVNGRRIPVPPSDGFLYAIGPDYDLHRSKVSIKEIRSLSSAFDVYDTELWKKRLHPFLKENQWPPPVPP